MTTMTRKIATAAALLALASLGGCDWFKPAPPPETVNNAAAIENIDVPDETAPPNAAVPTDANAAADLREAPPAPDAQTQDDADAVGMTAHVRRDEGAGNTTAP